MKNWLLPRSPVIIVRAQGQSLEPNCSGASRRQLLDLQQRRWLSDVVTSLGKFLLNQLKPECMKFSHQRMNLVAPAKSQVWILGVVDSYRGWYWFYAVLRAYLVNQVGLSSTSLALPWAVPQSLRVLVASWGVLLLIPGFGDAVTLLLSAAVAAIASLVLATTNNFPLWLW